MFDRKEKIKNFAVLGVWSAAHLEAFLIKQGMLFFVRLQCFRHVQRHAHVITHLICWSLKFRLPPPEGGIWKIKKGGGSMVQGQVLLKWGDWHFSYLIFSRFIIFTFRNYFTLCKIVLCIWRKTIFFCHHNFLKKDHSKLSKTEPENIP